MKFIKQAFVILVAMLFASPVFAEVKEGKDYTVISPALPTNSGNKIEVLEFFFYGCSHCFKMYPVLSEWEKKMPKDVKITHVPTIFNPAWESMARTYYALESLELQKRLDGELYNAWNVNNMNLSEDDKAIDFVAKHGVDRKKFSDAYNAFSMQGKIMRSKQMAQSYNIRGTPTLIVDGKYTIAALPPADTIRVLDALVDKARKERMARKH